MDGLMAYILCEWKSDIMKWVERGCPLSSMAGVIDDPIANIDFIDLWQRD